MSNKLIINNEECRKLISFERYHISESGRIYRTETDKKRSWRAKGRVFISEIKVHFRIRNDKLQQGFASLTDTKGKLHNIAVAPLVAITFGVLLKKLKKKKQAIGYRDGNKRNLHYSNLFVIEHTHINSKLNSKDVKHIKKQINKEAN